MDLTGLSETRERMVEDVTVHICLNLYRCNVHFGNCKVHTPTNALLIKLEKVLKFALKITSTCSYMFRFLSTTIMGEPSLEPS